MGVVLLTGGIKECLGLDQRDLWQTMSHTCELEPSNRTPHSHANHGQRTEVTLRTTCEAVKQTSTQEKKGFF